jgi:hypothetical protein
MGVLCFWRLLLVLKGIQAEHSGLSGDWVSTESLNQTTAAKGRTETNQSHDVLHA